jgi:hypothetical protein
MVAVAAAIAVFEDELEEQIGRCQLPCARARGWVRGLCLFFFCFFGRSVENGEKAIVGEGL